MDEIETKPSPMSKRQRKWYDLGRTAGIKWANDQHDRNLLEFRNRGWELRSAQNDLVIKNREVELLNCRVAELKRELQFANDRIEQLTNSVVIIREAKK